MVQCPLQSPSVGEDIILLNLPSVYNNINLLVFCKHMPVQLCLLPLRCHLVLTLGQAIYSHVYRDVATDLCTLTTAVCLILYTARSKMHVRLKYRRCCVNIKCIKSTRQCFLTPRTSLKSANKSFLNLQIYIQIVLPECK